MAIETIEYSVKKIRHALKRMAEIEKALNSEFDAFYAEVEELERKIINEEVGNGKISR